jgi:hypothetical protein
MATPAICLSKNPKAKRADISSCLRAILNIAHIFKHVMMSATKAELAALYIMAREAVYMRIILE